MISQQHSLTCAGYYHLCFVRSVTGLPVSFVDFVLLFVVPPGVCTGIITLSTDYQVKFLVYWLFSTNQHTEMSEPDFKGAQLVQKVHVKRR